MHYDDKTKALAEFLKVNPALISNDYSHYYTINERTVKVGKSPEEIQKTADDLRLLLDKETQDLVTDCIINPYPPEQCDKVYEAVKEQVAPLEAKADRYQASKNQQFGSPRVTGYKENDPVVAYARLKEDNLYVSNVIYHLVKDGSGNSKYVLNLRRAWLGMPVNDIRQDSQVNDGEYLVMTDEEADEWEREGLDNLFDDIVEIPAQLEKYVDKEKWIEDHSGNRGNNISGYDGIENSIEVDGTTYYIYRHN